VENQSTSNVFSPSERRVAAFDISARTNESNKTGLQTLTSFEDWRRGRYCKCANVSFSLLYLSYVSLFAILYETKLASWELSNPPLSPSCLSIWPNPTLL
jgi:hypothetical protein